MMSKVAYEIKSRGSMLVTYNNKQLLLTGELVFEPPVFYADLNSILKWEPPFDNVQITEEEKTAIMKDLLEESEGPGKTKIIFD